MDGIELQVKHGNRMEAMSCEPFELDVCRNHRIDVAVHHAAWLRRSKTW